MWSAWLKKQANAKAAWSEEAQSFDRIADVYDRLCHLGGKERIGPWLEGLVPVAGVRALDLGCTL